MDIKHTFFSALRVLALVCLFELGGGLASYTHGEGGEGLGQAHARELARQQARQQERGDKKKPSKSRRKVKKTQKAKSSRAVKPYFASLRGEDVSLRSGPGVRYPVRWVYTRASIPLEVLTHHKDWRRVRDWDGESGWVPARALVRSRFVVVTDSTRSLYQEPSADSNVVAKVQKGVFAALQRCQRTWCFVAIGEHSGWLRRHEFWGTHQNEVIK